jgi:hypothetical protein
MRTVSVVEMSQAEILQAIANGTFKLIPEDTHPDYLKEIAALKPALSIKTSD